MLRNIGKIIYSPLACAKQA